MFFNNNKKIEYRHCASFANLFVELCVTAFSLQNILMILFTKWMNYHLYSDSEHSFAFNFIHTRSQTAYKCNFYHSNDKLKWTEVYQHEWKQMVIMVLDNPKQKIWMNLERERKIQSTPKGAESFSLRFRLITQIVSSFSRPFDLIIRMIKNLNSIQITMIKVEVKPNDRKVPGRFWKSIYFVFFGLFEGFFFGWWVVGVYLH